MIDLVGPNDRILIVDDNREVHHDFRKILCPSRTALQVDALEQSLFGDDPGASVADDHVSFSLDSAFQGEEALARVVAATAAGTPYALAFVDMRMPPGWDGVETIARLWAADPDLQVVICSAYTDYSWRQIVDRVGQSDGLLILKKPFDNMEVVQVASAFSAKWKLQRETRRQTENLQAMVDQRTKSLAEVNEKLRHELEEKARMEAALRLSHRLEAVGRLAAGIAHEINTPIQFVGDSLTFLRESMTDIGRVLERYAELQDRVSEGAADEASQLAAAVTRLKDDLDFSYVVENVPGAISRSLEGIDRVATIIRSVKEFAHPSYPEMSTVDLNEAIQSTLALGLNEYRQIADIETDYGEIPRVTCHVGQINQAVLSMLVNAMDAIAATGRRGKVTVRTRREGDQALIAIGDTGTGIPDGVRDHLFDPFFTTKGVGRGTGQGLAIARVAVVEKHRGQLTFETEPGRGTTFFIRLPFRPPA